MSNSEDPVPAVNETREDIPLKTGTKSTSWYCFTDDCLSGVKFINIAFATLTIVITAALLIQIYYGDYQVVPHGSVATDNIECSKIGTSILKKGGKAIDAAIASAFCLAVATPHLTSLDGEGQILLYNHHTRLLPTLIDFTYALSDKLPKLVLGLAYAHKEYGTVPWKDLVEPSAKLARDGYLISKELVKALKKADAESLYGRLEPGQLLKHEVLGRTLEQIANIPEKELYNYIEPETRPTESLALQGNFKKYNIFVPNSKNTSAGPLLLKNLKEIESYNFTQADSMNPEYFYRIADVTQQFYKNVSLYDHFHECVSTNIGVIDLEDNYVSLITGMYQLLGTAETTSLGYILDIHGANRTLPCGRVPLIITDNNFVCGRRVVTGVNSIGTAVQMIASILISQQNATGSVEAPRFYVLSNGTVAIEETHSPSFSDEIVKYLETLSTETLLLSEPYQSCNVVEKNRDELNSHSDSRGGGVSSRF